MKTNPKHKTLYPSKFLPAGSVRQMVNGVRMWVIKGKTYLSKAEYFQYLRDAALAKREELMQPTREITVVEYECPTCGQPLAFHIGDDQVIGVDCSSGNPCQLSPELAEYLIEQYKKSLQSLGSMDHSTPGTPTDDRVMGESPIQSIMQESLDEPA